MSAPEPLLRRGEDVAYEEQDAADGMYKGVLIGPDDAPNYAMRRFRLDPGTEVPRHTNRVEHEQYVISGPYVVGIEDEEHVVETGDSLFVPGGTVHWYRNEGDEPVSFICVVPNEDDEIEMVE
ncbi:Cupin domain containing protein [Halanaeroarchaeum sp. HSR-CO]|uniref:cupin domain-containing protein n=1 Tax=Halanaeroarchaeum sp. HSR-CO TaxID=2866382 RepID=UPI00217EE62B|nr:cupin domain-containing protein [Halanaeroarchaeum sp. HSR-CO]UWG46521.1 Cupin domain containing protein [Halanaeroarchaeum sp. HSR-CO]